MSKFLLISFGSTIFFITTFFLLARISQSTHHYPLNKAHLDRCPNSPNCVCTEYGGGVNPIELNELDPHLVWSELQKAIVFHGGNIIRTKPDYLWAIFQTPFFGFTDDVEARLDLKEGLIHLRSASRIGYYDFGVNRKRVIKLKKSLQANADPRWLKNIHE